jgi:hypothetical protein
MAKIYTTLRRQGWDLHSNEHAPTTDIPQIHHVGGKIIVDSTFAPPPLQYPFRSGADWYDFFAHIFPGFVF